MALSVKRALKQAARNAALTAGYCVTARTDEHVWKATELLRPNSFGATLIRIGPWADGGYLVPDDLEGVRSCISPGVSDQVGFDLAIAERGVDVFMFDGSVNGPPIEHDRFHFSPTFLDSFNSATTSTLERTLSHPVLAMDQELLLQMDIEGAEYRVLGAASRKCMERFRIILLELHGLDRLFRAEGAEVVALLERMAQTHDLVHTHVNNYAPHMRVRGTDIPEVVELTYHRRDRRLRDQPSGVELPHPLDRNCNPDAGEREVPFWLRGPAGAGVASVRSRK